MPRPPPRRRSRSPSRNPSPPRHDRGGHRDDARQDPPLAAAPDLNAVLSRWVTAAATLQERSVDAMERISQVQVAARAPMEKVRVPKFNGTRAWSVFEAQFASAALNYGWSEAEKGRRLLSTLEGDAADLVQTLPAAEFECFASLRERLAEHYGPGQRALVAESELDRRTQQSGESLRDFAAEVLRLARVAYPTWQEAAIQTTARKCFVAGLRDSEVRRMVRLKQPVTLNDALLAASHVESVDQLDPPPAKRPRVAQVSVSAASDAACSSSAQPTPGCSTDQPAPVEVDVCRVIPATKEPAAPRRDVWAAIDTLRDALRRQSAPQRRSRSRSPRRPRNNGDACYKCNKVGHFQRDCPRLRHARRHNRSRSRSRDRRQNRGSNGDRDRPNTSQREKAGNDA